VFFAHPQTVRVNHRAIDRNGDYTVTDSYDLPGCAISLAYKTRAYETETPDRDVTRASTILFTPGKPDIRINDTITLLDDGTTWHVWGLPTAFQSPFTGWAPGMQVPLRYFSG
jgi:hypothetical protein